MGQFKDIIIQNGHTFYYRTGMTVYTERLQDGILQSLGWNGAGYALCTPMVNPVSFHQDYAFELELDSQSLISHWELTDTEKTETEKNTTLKITLRHKVRPVEVKVCTLVDGSCCLSRWLEITNLSSHPVGMSRLAPMSGALEQTPRWREHLSDSADSPYQLGYYEYCAHLHEMQYKRHAVPNAKYSFGARSTRLRFRHPFFTLENQAKGTTFIGQLAYSGGYSFSFDCNSEFADATLAFSADIDEINPIRVIDPGETIVSPKMIMGMVNGDLDEAVNGMHEHIRRSIMRPQSRGRGLWIETGGHGDIELDKRQADLAAANGFDFFMIDAGWYYGKGQEWSHYTGDWEVNRERYPNGLSELVDYCHEKGLLFGLWMEPERLASLSQTARNHPEYVITDYSGKNCSGYPQKDVGGVVDLSREPAEAWVASEIERIITTHHLDLFRLDYNCDSPFHSCNQRGGYLENVHYRYQEAIGRIYGRLREKFPNVVFENCASGGGRTDLGMVQYFDHTWVTDNPVAPRCFGVTNGATMCLPPEYVDRLVTTMEAHTMGELNFNLYQLLFVRPTAHFPSIFYEADTVENPEQKRFFDRFIHLYKTYSQKMIVGSKIYHHTPELNGRDPKGVGMLEMVSQDSSMAMFGVFALSDPQTQQQLVRFKGIDASRRYRFLLESTGDTFEIDGCKLKFEGVTVPLHGPLTAQLILLTAL